MQRLFKAGRLLGWALPVAAVAVCGTAGYRFAVHTDNFGGTPGLLLSCVFLASWLFTLAVGLRSKAPALLKFYLAFWACTALYLAFALVSGGRAYSPSFARWYDIALHFGAFVFYFPQVGFARFFPASSVKFLLPAALMLAIGLHFLRRAHVSGAAQAPRGQ